MTFYWSGDNVGVGITNPSKEFEVDGDINVTTGQDYNINQTVVLSATTLGSGVVNSSLQNLGTQNAALNMGNNNITNGGDLAVDNISLTGHIIPTTNDLYDIGSAEYQIRDMYVSDNSLWVGDQHKIAISDGKMKFRKRKTTSVPAAILTAARTVNGNATEAEVETAALAHAGGLDGLADMKLHHWEAYMRSIADHSAKTIQDIFRDNTADYAEESETNWLQSGTKCFNTVGNVGIGTQDPSALLSLHHTGEESFGLKELLRLSWSDESFNTLMGDGLKISWHTSNVDDAAGTAEAGYVGFMKADAMEAATHSDFTVGVNNGTNVVERIRILSSGKVGISKAAPEYELDVVGDINLTGDIRISGTAQTFANTQLTQEEVEDYVNGLVVAGSNITKTYDDAAGTLTIASADTNTQLSQEQVEDYINGLIVAGSNITKTYDDSAGTLTIASTASGGSSVWSESGSEASYTGDVKVNGGYLKVKQAAQTDLTSGTFYEGLSFENVSTTHAFGIGYNVGGQFAINYFDGSSTYSNILTIKNDGKVGIGVNGATDPQSTLHVEMSLDASGVHEIARFAWADVNPNRDTLAGDGIKISFHTSSVNNALGTVEGAYIAAVRQSGGEATHDTRLEFWTKDDSSSDIARRMVISDSGNVGIGDISTPTISLAIGDSDTGFEWIADGKLSLYTNGTERMRFDHLGNVGIGTNAPEAILHAKAGSSGRDFSNLYAQTSAIIEDDADCVLLLTGGNSNNTEVWFGDSDDTSSGQGRVRYEHNNNKMEFYTNGGEKMCIDSSGKVGIGTTTPKNCLQINCTGSDSSDGLMIVRNDSSTLEDNILGGIGFDSTDGNVPSKVQESSASIIAYASEPHGTGDKGGYLTFWTKTTNVNDDTNGTERVRIENDGCVLLQTGYLRGLEPGIIVKTTVKIASELTKTNTAKGSLTQDQWYTLVSYTHAAECKEDYHLLVEFFSGYIVDGHGEDHFESRLEIDEVASFAQKQEFSGQSGGGTRSNTLFPIQHRANQYGSTSGIPIKVQFRRTSGNDSITFKTDNMMLKLTEISK